MSIHFEKVVEVWDMMKQTDPEFTLSYDYNLTIGAILSYSYPNIDVSDDELNDKLTKATTEILIENMFDIERFQEAKPFGEERTRILTDYLLHEMWAEHDMIPDERKREERCQMFAVMVTLIVLHRSMFTKVRAFQVKYPDVNLLDNGLYWIEDEIVYLWLKLLQEQHHPYYEIASHLYNTAQSQKRVKSVLETLYKVLGDMLDSSVIAMGVLIALEEMVRNGNYK